MCSSDLPGEGFTHSAFENRSVEKKNKRAEKFNSAIKKLTDRITVLKKTENAWKEFNRKLKSPQKAPNIFSVLLQTIAISEYRLVKAALDANPPDILIQPKTGDIFPLDFYRARSLIERGEAAAEKALAAYFKT